MIRKYNFIAFLLAGVFAFAACNDEQTENPFRGNDSYITAFSLKQGETVFQAVIAGEEIIVTAPEGFSLTQAKASVTVSENAKIYPNPADIADWDGEHVFAVTAYNGGQTKYKYTVERSGIAHSGAIALETQADVDAFGQRGVTFIDGNLTIGRATGTDSITSLAPLAALKEVVYNLTINPTFAGTGLDELKNLQRIGGTFQMTGAVKHIEILTLPSLTTAGEFNLQNTVTIIVELPELVHVSKQLRLSCPLYQLQLPVLQYAGSLTLTTVSNSGASLANAALPALKKVDGVLSITLFHSLTRIDMPALKHAGGLTLSNMNLLSFVYAPQLEEITGTVNIAGVPALSEFALPELTSAGTLYLAGAALTVVDFPKLTEITTNLEIRNISANVLAGFPVLQNAAAITLTNMKDISRFSLPASVQHVGKLSVSSSTNPLPDEIDVRGVDIDILNVLCGKIIGDNVFGGTLSFDLSSSSVENLPLLEGFSEIDSLYVNSANMANVDIPGIRKVRKGIYMGSTYSSSPYSFSVPDLEEAGGEINIRFPYMSRAAQTFTAVGFEKLKRVGGNFSFDVKTSNAGTLSFPELTTVNGNFNLITGYDYSTSYAGFKSLEFPKLTSVSGKLTINSGSTSYSNTKLTNLDGFAALASVGEIEVVRQAALVSYEGLKEAFKSLASPDKWKTANNAYNPTYEDLVSGKWSY
jgi:hypothetical protein